MLRRSACFLILAGLSNGGAFGLEPNSLTLRKLGPLAVELRWDDPDPSAYCVLRDPRPPAGTLYAGSAELSFLDDAAGMRMLFYAVEESAGGLCSDSCLGDGDCGAGTGMLCRHPTGDCLGSGECVVVPAACDPLDDPVCGCDAITYPNPCEAARRGVSVAASGACTTGGCTTDAECAPTEFCQFPLGVCAPPGMCTVKPEICTAIYDPVCGCDGVTYSNACVAAGAGVSVAHDGMC